MRLSVALIACVIAGGVLFAGMRLSSAIGQVSAVAIPGSAAAPSPEDSGMHADPLPATSPAFIEAGSDTAIAVDDTDGTPVPAVDERELLLDYFGPEVSLNDIGQLAVPDPEFERAIRERANEIGEIQAEP